MPTKPATEVLILSDIAQALAESLDLESTLKSILMSLDTHFKLRRGTITLLDPMTETIRIRVAHGLSVDRRASRSTDFEADVQLLNIIATMVAQAVKLHNLVESDRRRLQDENVRLRQVLLTLR